MMKKVASLFCIFIVISFYSFSSDMPAMPQECQKLDRQQYGGRYQKMLNDSVSAQTKLLLIGSSSIQGWKAAYKYFKSYSEFEVLNRGVSGTRVCHLIVYADHILNNVKKLQDLQRIVIYSGDNDFAYKYSPKTIQEHYRYLIDLYRSKGIKAPFFIISTKPSPRRLVYKDKIKSLGKLLKENLNDYKDTHVLDRFSFYFNEDKSIKLELYQPDGLHLKPRVYWDWSWHLEKMWKS